MASSKREGERKSAIESESLDFISRLPDCVLCSIVFLLPIKEFARTSILSFRWRHLWKVAPLRLDDSSLRPDKPRFHYQYGDFSDPLEWPRDAVSCIFSSHHGPVESLRLSSFTELASFPAVDRLLESAVQRGIRELALEFDRKSYQLLPSVLQSESLHKLSLHCCRFPKPVLPSIFPNLKELRLNEVNLRNHLLQNLLSSCGSLETLQLSCCCVLLAVVRVRSPSLRKFSCCKSLIKKLVIEDAPNLESLVLDEHLTNNCEVMVLHAPKLELLGYVCMKVGDTLVKNRNPGYCGIRTLSTVKMLAIKTERFSNLGKVLPSLLRCLPCLENLDVLDGPDLLGAVQLFLYYWRGANFYHVLHWIGCQLLSLLENNDSGYTLDNGFCVSQDSFSFLDHLKTVTIKVFYGRKAEVEFLSYLVVHGKVLKKITLLCRKSITKKFVENKRRDFCMEKRASSDLELFFLEDTRRSDYFSPWNELVEVIHY